MNKINVLHNKVAESVKIYCFVFKEIHKASKFLLLILILSIFSSGLTPIINQHILKLMVSELEITFPFGAAINFKYFSCLCICYVITLIFRSTILNAQKSISRVVSSKLTYSIQTLLINKIKKIKYSVFYSPEFQNAYSLVLPNSQNGPSLIIYSIVYILSSATQILSSLILILYLNPLILLCMVLSFIPNIIVNMKTESNHVKAMDESSLPERKINYFFETMTNKSFIKELRLFNSYNFFLKLREESFNQDLSIWKKFSMREFRNKLLVAIFSCFVMFFVMLWLLNKTIAKQITIADFVFYSSVIFSLHSALENLTVNLSYHQKSMIFVKKLLKFLDSSHNMQCGNHSVSPQKTHTLEFINVSFKYPHSDIFVLKAINLKISTGEKIAIVGENGCGKTTLINLILRIYDPTDGYITLDGINIKDYSYEQYYSFFSAVFQDYQQYSVSIQDYITFNAPKLNKASKIKQALSSATIHDFVKKAPHNFNSNLTTRFDKHGLELSGGQWQKLAISRAFFSDASIIIFDEPTSSLDSISESKIYESIQQMDKTKASIFISHRMYTSKLADKIVYIEKGTITSIGTHDELIKINSKYKRLFDKQAAKYV